MAAIGGMSWTTNTSLVSWLLPGVNAIYEPESKVPKPVTPLLVDTRFDHPKLGIAADKVFGIGTELGSNFHAFLVVAQFDAGNASDIDVQHLNNGVVDFDAFGAVHQQR